MLSPRCFTAVWSGALLFAMAQPTQAQITPDATLGSEGSQVLPGVEVRGDVADLIEGGATRGGNLFHSFEDFNVEAGGRVYFANPAGIESILSRVTGGDLSNIFGTLGVDGTADLFLLNPNGIVFGETAVLDIQGSFFATTAEAIPLGEGIYSATEPEQSSLLTINPSALVSTYLSDASGDIENRGALAAQENLTLAANNLDLQGQVAAGGDLTLLGLDTVQIRDVVDTPFIAFAGGDLRVQGNQQVDIVALRHPDSGLYSYGDMVLRSANPVGGDAHYWSGDDFRVETLDGDVGDLFSPIDPIIRAFGDVAIEGYAGSSLHILAGGSVNLGTALITAPDAGAIGVDFLQETIELSDGTIVEVDGGAQPTLDVRAGVAPEAIGLIPLENPSGVNPATDVFFDEQLQLVDPVIGEVPSSADIEIGDVVIDAASGLVLLTNQYEPNPELPGRISITGEGVFNLGIDARGFAEFGGQGGAVYLDARGDVDVINSFISTTGLGRVGDIVINAEGTVRFDGTDGSRDTGAFANIATGTEDSIGGNLRINAENLEVLNGAQINSLVFGTGQGSDIFLNIKDNARFVGIDTMTGRPSGVSSGIEQSGEGKGGTVNVQARTLEVLNGALLDSSILGVGDAGSVILEIAQSARFSGVNSVNSEGPSGAFSSIQPGGIGKVGNVEVYARSLEVLDGARLVTSTFGIGNAGNVILEIRDTARFSGFDLIDGSASGAFSDVQPNGVGNSGIVELRANVLEILDGAQLGTGVFGAGNAGSIILEIQDTARFVGVSNIDGDSSGAFSSIQSGGIGNSGNLIVRARTLEVFDGAQLDTSVLGTGNAGNVVLEIRDTARFGGANRFDGSSSGAKSSIGAMGDGRAGNVEVRAANLEVLDGAQLSTSTFGVGDAGSVVLTIDEMARFVGSNPINGSASGANSAIASGGEGRGGDVQITARNLEVLDGAQLSASTFGTGEAGSVVLTIEDLARFVGTDPSDGSPSAAGSQVGPAGLGRGGRLEIRAVNLDVLAGALLSTQSFGIGDAGDLVLVIADQVLVDDSTVGTDSSRNAGGQITIQAGNIVLRNDGDIQTFVESGAGGGGNITIAADFVIALDDSDILAFSPDGLGGNIDLSQTTFFGQNPNIASGTLSREALLELDGNNRVDINATGGVASGQIFINDSSFVENSLTNLEDAIIDTAALTSGSCIARTEEEQGSFVITGRDGIPPRPGDIGIAAYPTGTVRTLAEPTATLQEPDGVYQLPDGRLVLSRECD
jgi:filamentous hemagglutinin family protein